MFFSPPAFRLWRSWGVEVFEDSGGDGILQPAERRLLAVQVVRDNAGAVEPPEELNPA